MNRTGVLAIADPWAGLRSAAPALLLGLVLLGLLFHAEAMAAVATWIASTAYNHGFLVVPIAVWLAWERRALLAGLSARPVPLAVLLAIPLGLVWFAAERLGIMEGRQLAVMALLQVLFLAVLGWRFYFRLAVPLLYLFFLVPFGAFIVPKLQDFTAGFIVHGLDFLGIPNFSDGNTIEIPEGTFYVAEACAGLRFLIASIAFGVLYAFMMYQRPVRRLVFIIVSIVVPILANGVRALGIVLLGHVLGSAQAAATDHVLYGWIFFTIVILLLTLLGLPFREAQAVPPAVLPAVPGKTGSLIRPALLLAVLAAAGPLAAMLFDRVAAAQPVAIPADLIPGCDTLRQAAGAARRFSCDGGAIVVTVAVFPPRTDPALFLAAMRKISVANDAEDVTVSPLAVPQAGPAIWRLVETEKPFRVTATALWIDARPEAGGLRTRLIQGWHSIAGAASAPVLVVLSPRAGAAAPTPAGQPEAHAAIRAFLAARPDFTALMARLSASAVRPR
jgi:exosortase A